jgi:nitronate monooxygenase
MHAVMPTAAASAFMARFGLRYPIMQAPYGGPALAAAISNAGALGTVSLWVGTGEAARERVQTMRQSTAQLFAVNYVLSFEPRSLPTALDAGAPIVHFSWGVPTAAMTTMVRERRARFGVQIATVEGAAAALDAGASYLVCQGIEAGGHVQSSTPLYELLPRVVERAKDTPVLAAGGISRGGDIANALRAGASGVLVGTRFVATQESMAHPEYKAALVGAAAADTALSVCFQDGWPGAVHRTLRNRTLERWEAAGCPPVGQRPGEGDIVARLADGSPVARYHFASPQRGVEGHVTDLALYAGAGVGAIIDLPPAAELIRRLWAECVSSSEGTGTP